jgi:outer membrane immunogenic protein
MNKIAIAALALAALIGTPASAADMAVKAATKAPQAVAASAPVTSWAGFYIGGNAGGGVATANVYDPDCFFCNDSTLHIGFAELGGQAGYNWQIGHAVVGIEGELNWQSFKPTTGTIATVEVTNTKLDAFASLRLRAGLASDRTLAYVTFGPAWGHANSVSTQFTNASLTTIAEQATDKAWHGGIAAGAGIEYMLAPNWAVRGEYLYLD